MNRSEFSVDKTAFSVVPLSAAGDDLEFWLTKTPEERLRAVELVRRTLYGYTDPMATPILPPDFKDFLKSFDESGVEYLLVGGYAVGYHGYVRATADLDVWVARSPENARRVVAALKRFGMDVPGLSEGLFLEEANVVRMGVPPFRIEILTSVSGVEFADCYPRRVEATLDGVRISVIDLTHLKANKLASGRAKDLADLDQLP